MNDIMIQRRAHIVLFVVVLALLSGCGLFVSSHHKTEEYTPLFAAANACDLATVRQEVDRNRQLLTATEWENATLLHDAVGQNCNELSAYLVEAGADVNARRSDGVTPLHIAAQRGNIPIAELLIRHGAKINAIDEKGWTPLDRAEQWHHEDAAAFLMNYGGKEGNSGG